MLNRTFVVGTYATGTFVGNFIVSPLLDKDYVNGLPIALIATGLVVIAGMLLPKKMFEDKS